MIPWDCRFKNQSLGRQFALGGSDYFVVEGDEYRAHMLELNPQAISSQQKSIYDHPHYYSDLNHTIGTLQAFINKLPADGHYIYHIWRSSDFA